MFTAGSGLELVDPVVDSGLFALAPEEVPIELLDKQGRVTDDIIVLQGGGIEALFGFDSVGQTVAIGVGLERPIGAVRRGWIKRLSITRCAGVGDGTNVRIGIKGAVVGDDEVEPGLGAGSADRAPLYCLHSPLFCHTS